MCQGIFFSSSTICLTIIFYCFSKVHYCLFFFFSKMIKGRLCWTKGVSHTIWQCKVHMSYRKVGWIESVLEGALSCIDVTVYQLDAAKPTEDSFPMEEWLVCCPRYRAVMIRKGWLLLKISTLPERYVAISYLSEHGSTEEQDVQGSCLHKFKAKLYHQWECILSQVHTCARLTIGYLQCETDTSIQRTWLHSCMESRAFLRSTV